MAVSPFIKNATSGVRDLAWTLFLYTAIAVVSCNARLFSSATRKAGHSAYLVVLLVRRYWMMSPPPSPRQVETDCAYAFDMAEVGDGEAAVDVLGDGHELQEVGQLFKCCVLRVACCSCAFFLIGSTHVPMM